MWEADCPLGVRKGINRNPVKEITIEILHDCTVYYLNAGDTLNLAILHNGEISAYKI